MFSFFKGVLSFYLLWHLYSLYPYSDELFGEDMPYDPNLSPTSVFPNALNFIDAKIFIILLFVITLLFLHDFHHRVCAGILWYGWACLLNRNVLISNPGIPYVGWLLLASVFIPSDKIPRNIFWVGWFLMAMGYTVSGLHKLQCPSWISGDALRFVLESPLARDNIFVDIALGMPDIFLKIATWSTLFLEISFLPLGTLYHTRCLFWLIYMFLHMGILLLINFTDLTFGVLMIHVFTLDAHWFRRASTRDRINKMK